MLLIFVGLALVYLANGREIGTYDSIGTALLPLTLLRGEGVYLDRFRPILREGDGRLPAYLGRFGSHLVSRYPVGPALLVLPLVAPQIMMLDAIDPGWDRDPVRAFYCCMRMAKRAAAGLTALTGVVLYLVLVRLGLGRVAWPAVLAAALGSDLRTVASQALWQHGPAALCLMLAIWLLLPRPLPRWRLVLASLAVTALVWCRAIDAPLALVIALWVAWNVRRGLAWFLPVPIVGALGLIGWNLWLFGTVTGGQAELGRLHVSLRRVSGPWSGDLLSDAAGTLFSPNRGLFIFSPWVLVALATAPFAAKRLAPWPIVDWMLWSLLPFGLMFSKYAVWWGGHCFGPRYWTDVMPLFAILLALGLDGLRARSRPLMVVFALSIAWSVGVQAIGAFCYPSSWNLSPANVDRAHDRLWDWHDTELSRCLTETLGSARGRLR